jgi:hypothetical protein
LQACSTSSLYIAKGDINQKQMISNETPYRSTQKPVVFFSEDPQKYYVSYNGNTYTLGITGTVSITMTLMTYS